MTATARVIPIASGVDLITPLGKTLSSFGRFNRIKNAAIHGPSLTAQLDAEEERIALTPGAGTERLEEIAADLRAAERLTPADLRRVL